MKVGKGPAGKSEAGQGWEEMQQGGRLKIVKKLFGKLGVMTRAHNPCTWKF